MPVALVFYVYRLWNIRLALSAQHTAPYLNGYADNSSLL